MNSQIMKYNFNVALDNSITFLKRNKLQRLSQSPIKVIYALLLKSIALTFNYPIKVWAKTFWGDNMLVVLPEPVSYKIFLYNFFEEKLSKIFLRYLMPGMTLLDIGTHFGYFTLLGAKIIGSSGQVHSFEPTPSTFDILKANTCNISNIKINNFAISDKAKSAIFHDYGLRYSAFNSLYDARLSKELLTKSNSIKYIIKCISIDDYVEEDGIKPNLIKIDAESSEFDIIIGMQKTIDKYCPIITIEVGDLGVTGAHESKEIINILVKKGYQAFECKNGTIMPHLLINEPYMYNNLLFLPMRK